MTVLVVYADSVYGLKYQYMLEKILLYTTKIKKTLVKENVNVVINILF